DPGIVMFDEPVNGLDPEGILWIRNLMKALAAEGRTVFVSSHLMSEMAVTADDLVVIGRGRLIAETSVAQFLAESSAVHVRVRSPEAGELERLLRSTGAEVRRAGDGALEVVDLNEAAVGDLAAAGGLRVHELVLQSPSLEAAYMELTRDAVDYRAAAAL
ncbi:MAG: ABC transporter ATP-binding protein, partial [Acidimicrobiia bacterium]|nr:ABC transporter ATP-binding protein [Acidimicrobiia bacterium]